MNSPLTLDTIVIGAGLTGLTVGHHLLKDPNHKFTILEKEERSGGQIRTLKKDGFTFESGPTSGIISTSEVADLFEDFPNLLNLATPLAKRRMILKGQEFHPLPSGLKSAITTTLFSTRDKIRILGEPFRAKGTDPNESIGHLVKRRLGESYFHYAVDPFIGGIYAGDPEKLVTRHALPKLYALEANHGSFIKGAIALMKKKKTEDEKKITKAIFSSHGGLSTLTSALSDELLKANALKLGALDIEIRFREDLQLWQVTFYVKGEKEELFSRNLITTIGSLELANTLKTEVNLTPITQLRYAPIVQVALGYKSANSDIFASFGGLIPSCEDKEVLGILNPSACFSDRCPKGGLLLSVFLGGMRSPHLIEQSDDYIKGLIRDKVARFINLKQEPDLIEIFRHPRAIPQYEASTDERLALIEKLEKLYPGLYIGGNIHDGIGMSDRIKQGASLAHKVLSNKTSA